MYGLVLERLLTASLQMFRMPSIVSGLNDAKTRPLIREAVSISRLVQTAGYSATTGQMTPGKRKASDMDVKDAPRVQDVSSIDRNSFSRQAELEESPRVKRMRLAPRDGDRGSTYSDSAKTGHVNATQGMCFFGKKSLDV